MSESTLVTVGYLIGFISLGAGLLLMFNFILNRSRKVKIKTPKAVYSFDKNDYLVEMAQ